MKEHGAIDRSFRMRLGRFAGAWKRGQALALCLRIARWAMISATLYFAADYFLALNETTRRGLNLVLPLAWLIAALPEAQRIRRAGLGDIARRADRLGRHRRNEILTAWELLRAPSSQAGGGDGTALPAFLVRRSVEKGLAAAEALPPRRLRPAALLTRQKRLLALQGLLSAGVLLLFGVSAIRTIVPRMLWPGRDIPPFSRYRFEVAPQTPVILYGGTAELSVTIRGAPVRDRVWLRTRLGNGGMQRAACFQEGDGRYAQRLENVTQPLAFCFAVGRARSRWHTVDLQLQPRVLRARVRLAPPPYTGLPPVEFPAGQADVAGVRGTQITLTLTSNRPLREGTLTLRRRGNGAADDRVIAADRVSERTAEFVWTLQEDAEARATLRDLQGTATAEPVVLPQRRRPDEPPRVALIEPPEFSLATPGAVLNLSGQVEDDFGIGRIDWIRGLVGFHDRGVTLRRGPIGPQAEIAIPLDLGALGVEAGQVIEFYLEAMDNNPRRAGAAGSGIARVKIISDEEYADMRRDQETLEDFTGRYRAAEAAMAAVLEALEALRGAVSNEAPPAELEAAIGRAAEAHAAADRRFRTLARDFALYDVERALSAASEDVLRRLAENRSALEAMAQAPESCSVAGIEALAARLKDGAEELADQAEMADRLVRIARVMEGAARFQALVQRQADLVRRLTYRYETTIDPADRPFLPRYGEEEAAVARELAAFAADTATAAEALPDEREVLKRDTLAFLQALARTGASNSMERAVVASRNSDARKTCREARLALEKLRSLLPEDASKDGNGFADLCRGLQPGFGAPNVAATLQAMFRSICRRHGVGSAPGQGMGWGNGGAGPGFGASGYSTLATPVYGPPRSRAGGVGDGRGDIGAGGHGRGGAAGASPAVVERLRPADGYDPAGEAVPIERLPARYREAVKRYFQETTHLPGGL